MARQESDYDKQYEEDLERAQALSLESLALEQFKNKKRLKDMAKTVISETARNVTVSRKSSITESDSKQEIRPLKPRPRPEAILGSQGPGGSLIAPPPASLRRNSSTSSCNTDTHEPDLISFTNPPPRNSVIGFCLDSLTRESQPQPAAAAVAPAVTHQSPFTPNYHPRSNSIIPHHSPFQYHLQHSASSPLYPPQPGFRPMFMQQWQQQQQQQNVLSFGQNVSSPPRGFKLPMPLPGQSPQSPASASKVPVLQPTTKPQPPPLVYPTATSRQTSRTSTASNDSNNLIDLAQEERNSVRVSILEEFDPILTSSDCSSSSMRTTSPDCLDDSGSVCGSVYDEYDPYDFIYTGSGNNSLADPIYAAVVKSESAPVSPPPPLPPRAHSTLERRKTNIDTLTNKNSNLTNTLSRTDKKKPKHDADLEAFHKLVLKVRKRFHCRDPDTNMGLVISPMVRYKYKDGTSIKLCVHPDYEGADFNKPISFTCDVTTSIEHVTLQLVYDLDAPAKNKYTLKVWGYNEYLAPTTLLSDYEYVHNCIKLEEDVVLILIPDSKVDRSFARTLQDDRRDTEIKFEDLVPNEPNLHISYDNIKILLDNLEKEINKLVSAAKQIDASTDPSLMPALQPSAVIQSVKLVVKIMGTIVTLEIAEAIDSLEVICRDFIQSRIEPSEGTLSYVIGSKCANILLSIQNLIEMYCQAFRVDFLLKTPTISDEGPKYVTEITDTILVRICALHRPQPEWKHESFMIAAQIYHGTRPVGQPVLSQPNSITDHWYPVVNFNYWFDIDGVQFSSLARESRLVLVLYGRTLQTDGGDNNSAGQYTQEELGWGAVQFFNYDGNLIQGSLLVSVWPKETSHVYGPAPPSGTHPHPDHPVFSIEIPATNAIFPPVDPDLTSNVVKGDFSSLDLQTQQLLMDVSAQDMLYKLPSDIREVLWEKRHYLYNLPEALPKVLLAAHSWEWTFLPDLHGMLYAWKPLQPIQALEMLLPTFPDMEVRKYAVKWINGLSNDELVDYLPQLVVALRHETYEDSRLAEFLLDRSLRSPRFAHHFFWLLSHSLPGSIPQNCSFDNVRDPHMIAEARHQRRMTLMLRALLAVCGDSLRKCFITQQLLVKDLNDIAENVQKAKDSQKMNVLCNGLENVHHNLSDTPTSLPLSPTLRMNGIQVRTCSYFNSNTLPLKINFLAHDGSIIPAIYKVGDDLQQDMLTLQMVRLMDKLWLNEGLDLKMVVFSCIPTGKKKGMIEMVPKAETLRKIQVEHGLTGSFKDKPIAEWLAKHNPTELEYGRAVENFTASCAGYCVVTYILGICDRHNDNIMLKTSGHLFHIDFGKFLGDAQMFGNFKRDRTPFVLTSDMAYVINGGDKPSEKFHKFVDLCCQAFNIIRNNGNLFLYLFMLMASAGIKGVTPEAVNNLHRALAPQQSNPEAAAYFARLIESSLKSWFTQFNFFLHNLAQLKFTGDHGDGELLSFVPKTYSETTDGRLTHVEVVSYRKRYDPDKYYVYILRVYRRNQNQPMEILRTYKEFCELHQKLCLHFPLAKLHSLPTGMHIGRSNIKQVAQKRFADICLFVTSLFKTADEIAHSDLVYTFFHPLLRDQRSLEDYIDKSGQKSPDTKGRLKGQLKLSIQFHKGVFSVMVHHARGLPLIGNGQEPSTYVKVYLTPDPVKSTKRKTKVVKRTCHPSFMEMLEYRMPLEIVKERVLKATVWNHDPLQENEFLGGVELELNKFDLTQEMTEWFPLVNLSR